MSYTRCRRLFLGCIVWLFAVHCFAASFVIKAIKIRGLHRINYNTALSYLPVKVGQRFDEQTSSEIITALYSTGFFDNVRVKRNGERLIIEVVERPTIGIINVRGNKDIPKKTLLDVLKKLGLSQGHVFDPATLDAVEQQLRQQYNNRGKYGAEVSTKVTELARNRVAIDIIIAEGSVAKIKQINIIGNSVFSDRKLIKQMQLSTSSLFTLYNKKDRYSKAKLEASLEVLRSYYYDRGYLKFRIVSDQVSLAPDRSGVYITIVVDEGARFKVSSVSLSGQYVLNKQAVRAMIPIKAGDVFSRRMTTAGINNIGIALGDVGFGFPKIRALPEINNNNHTVALNFQVDAGKRIYVRRINFTGNLKTADYVLRRAMRQDEAGQLSLKKIRESERQLRILGFLSDVSVNTDRVPGVDDQVDLNVKVKEAPSAVAHASVGVGSNGFEFNAGFNQHNFLGTGNLFGLNFVQNPFGRQYSLTYYNPFYTSTGIGRGVNLYFQQQHPSKNLKLTTYRNDLFGGDLTYNIPIDDKTSLQVGAGYQHIDLSLVPCSGSAASCANRVPVPTLAFFSRYGNVFNQGRITLGLKRNSYDKFPFPTKGVNQTATFLLAFPLDGQSLKYFKASYKAHALYPVSDTGFILSFIGSVGYGQGFGDTASLPFFEHFYAGGAVPGAEVRGFRSYSLGPLDKPNTTAATGGDAYGGNVLFAGTAELILPEPLSGEKVRTSLFVDAGNVFNHNNPAPFAGFGGGGLRYSAGVAVEWRSPYGPLQFSLATPLNKQPGDLTEQFQFTIASGF